MAVIYEDTRQQRGKHDMKHGWWASHGVSITSKKLDFGDYMADGSNVSVDTKRNIDEIAQNINGRNHARFKRECQRAAAAGYRLVVLIENREHVSTVGQLKKWTNGHCAACREHRADLCDPHERGMCPRHGTRKPIQGQRLALAMSTMQSRYGVRFEFCKPSESARRICELLGVMWEDG